MKRKFYIKELVTCRHCNGTMKDKGGTCLMCIGGKTEVIVPLEEVLKTLLVDVPNTGYFGIITQRDDKPTHE